MLSRTWEDIMMTLWDYEYYDRNTLFDIEEFNKARAEYRLTIREPIIVDYYFITVNPKPDVKLDLFLKLLGNFVKRKPVVDYAYVIEQRGETEDAAGEGFHAHLLVSWNRNMTRKVRQYAGETFKRVIGANNNNIININKIPKDFWNDKLDYMNGLKWDAEKETKLKIDKIFREQNNILHIYKNGTV